MRNVFVLFVFFTCFGPLTIEAQNFYWVAFTNKDNTPWSLSFPEEFLSERAIQRREKQNIAIDSLDLPVNPFYISQVLELGAELIHSSKWLNGITVRATNETFQSNALQLPFVKEAVLSKRASGTKSAVNKFYEPEGPDRTLDIDTTVYGESAYQVAQLNGQFLHNQDFKGQEIHIAVLDAGFYSVDRYPAFDSLWVNGQIRGTRDFVSANEHIFETHSHGMSVLSILGGNIPGRLIGTAPKAFFWLIRTEDAASEFMI